MAVENSPAHLSVLNPLRVIQYPYNNNLRDLERRDYFWEFFFRSAHFGEFNHGDVRRPLARTMLLLALAGLPLLVAGLVITVWQELYDRLPLLLTFAILVAALFYLRLTKPYACCQDYRFIPLVIVPAGYFILRAISAMPRRWQSLALAGVAVYAGCCAVFTTWLIV